MKLIKLPLIAAALAMLATPALAGATLDRVMANKKLVMSSDPEYPPQSFLNDKNEMDGFDVAVGREIAKRMGAELEIITPSWDIITAGNWNGRWDISVGSMTPTKERAQVLSFPAIYYYVPAAFAVHNDSKITTMDELASLLAEGSRPTLPQALWIARQTCEALAALHRQADAIQHL